MSAMRRRGTAAALSLLFCLPVAAKDTVTWFVDQSYPPAHIASGPYVGEGILDRELSWVIAHLPQYDHIVVGSTAARLGVRRVFRDPVSRMAIPEAP